MKKLWLVALMVVPVLVTMGCAAEAPKEAPKVVLPKEAQKLSAVIPAMGEHWADPNKLPLGPIYLVHKGEVIGLEYQYTEKDMKNLSIPWPAGVEHFKVLADLLVRAPTNGALINHIDISLMPKGHEGHEVSHWDIHLYFITPTDKNLIWP